MACRDDIFNGVYYFFAPIGFIRDAIYVLLSVDKYSFFAGLISFVLDILYYYIWGCVIVYIIKLYTKRAIKNNSLEIFSIKN